MKRSASKNRSIFQFIVATLLLSSSIVLAGSQSYDGKTAPPPSNSCESPSPVEFRVLVFPVGSQVWKAISGSVAIVSPLDVKFTDILERLDAIAVLSGYVRYHRWEFFADGRYLKLSDSVRLPGILFDRANVEVESAFIEWFVGYRVINCKQASLSVFVGGRYNYMNGDLQIFDDGDPRFPVIRDRLGIPANLRVSGSQAWVDPVVGVGGKVRVAKPVMLYAKGDIGGFGAASISHGKCRAASNSRSRAASIQMWAGVT